MKLTGKYKIKAITKRGVIYKEIENTITSVGKTTVADLINYDGSANKFRYIGIGIGSSTPALSDTALGTEVYGRIDATGTTNGSVSQFTANFSITGAVDITEYGVFNASSAGSLLSRASGTAISLANGDSLDVTSQITIG